ncbi:MAG: GTP cyclohydrolase I FolE [Gammaproteobacteria bacterium]|nr:GTP cyclohydrolase I FolE [Gammaproteobacteria bacterium]
MNKKALAMLAGGRYLVDVTSSDEDRDRELESHVRKMLQLVGENPVREGLVDTPERVSKALHFLTGGYDLTVDDVVKNALFEEHCEEMIIVKDVEFYSLCEHHMLPFFGRAHVGYLPRDHIIGLSKIARVVDVFARRLQVQERLTTQIASGLLEVLNAHGVAVVLEASHFCMVMRGVQKQNSKTVTSSMLGAFREDSRSRSEFMELIRD